MTSGDLVDGIVVHIVDLGRDVVAQEQPDGLLVLAVRPQQSFTNAVTKTREAIALARGQGEGGTATLSTAAIRQMLRPYWSDEARASVDEFLESEQEPVEPEAEVAPPPASPRAARRSVRLSLLATGISLVAFGAFAGWQATGMHTALYHKETTAPFSGPVFDAFGGSGANCQETSPGKASCVAPDGTVMAGESLLGPGQDVYNFFYNGNERVTTRSFDDEDEAVLWAIRDGAMAGTRTVRTGRVVINGTEPEAVVGYAKVLARHFREVAYQHDGAGPPELLYLPPGVDVGPPPE